MVRLADAWSRLRCTPEADSLGQTGEAGKPGRQRQGGGRGRGRSGDGPRFVSLADKSRNVLKPERRGRRRAGQLFGDDGLTAYVGYDARLAGWLAGLLACCAGRVACRRAGIWVWRGGKGRERKGKKGKQGETRQSRAGRGGRERTSAASSRRRGGGIGRAYGCECVCVSVCVPDTCLAGFPVSARCEVKEGGQAPRGRQAGRQAVNGEAKSEPVLSLRRGAGRYTECLCLGRWRGE